MSAKKTPDLILGTAGHIDHGKSALVCALTGTDPDRLAEEKRRGITIELGFAQLELPDGTTMGVVDVPGHERFVRQMIAGATGIDVALLVIAADDGIMPQTIEHLAVLQTLGVSSCVVALTKTDLVDDEWIEFMRGEIHSYLADTPYAGADIVAVSSRTRAGLDELLDAIARACHGVSHNRIGDKTRLPIDRIFSIRGAGTVATGTLWSGTIHTDDTVEILPSRLTCRVRSIQVHNSDVDEARAGNRVALNLSGVSTDEVRPGDFIVAPGLVEPTDHFDAWLSCRDIAAHGKPLKSGERMHIAHGTREVLGRVLFCDGREQLGDGQSTMAQIRLEEPLPVSYGDRFIIRKYSPVQVAGGGMVLLAHPRHRTNLVAGEHTLLEALRDGDLQTAVESLAALETTPFSVAELVHTIGIDDKDVTPCVVEGCRRKHMTRIGDTATRENPNESSAFYTTTATRQRLLATLDRTLRAAASAHPDEAGVSKDALRRTCFPRMSPECFDAILDEATRAGAIVRVGGLIGHPSAQGSAKQAQQEAAEVLLQKLRDSGLETPTVTEMAEQTGIAPALVRKAMALLEESGDVFRLTSESFISEAALKGAKRTIGTWLDGGGDGTAAALRDALGTTRKYAIPLLEYLDAGGFTVRDGDVRRLR